MRIGLDGSRPSAAGRGWDEALAVAGRVVRGLRERVGLRAGLWRLAFRLESVLTVVVIAVAVVQAVVPLVTAGASALVIGLVPAAVRHGLRSGPGREMVAAVLVMGVALVLSSAAGTWQMAWGETLGRRVDAVLDRELMAAASGVWGRAGAAVRGLVGACVIVGTLRWWLGAALLVAALGAESETKRAFARVASDDIGQTGRLRRAGYYRDVALGSEAAKELRVFGLGGFLLGRFRAEQEAAAASARAVRRVSHQRVPAAIACLAAVLTGCLVVIAVQAAGGHLSLTLTAFYAQAVTMSVTGAISGAALQLMTMEFSVATLGAHQAALARLRERAPAPAVPVMASAGLPRREIRFEGVTFGYPGRERPVLDGLDLVIPAGRSLAVVGLNGAGKTTLVKLLCRLYEPGAGRITADGIDIAGLDAAGWQRRVAVIFQDFTRYDLPAFCNVGWAAPELLASPDEALAAAREAARLAGALEIVEGLPNGWDTVLSPSYSGGTGLSGGQWQRVALSQVWEGTMIAAQFLVSLAVIARLQPWLLALPLLGLPAGYLTQRGARLVNRARGRVSEPGRRARHLLDLATTVAPARELRVFGSAGLVLDLHRQTTQEQDRVLAAAGARQSLLALAGYGLVGAGYAVALLLSVQAAAQGRLSVGDVALVMSLAGSAIGGLSALAGRLVQLQQGLHVSSLLVWITDQSRGASRPQPERGTDPAPVPERLAAGIEVDHVTFRYPDADSDTLRDISFRLAPGAVVALVGENGAGKTSLVKLLTRMYRPSRGRILLDGHDIQRFDVGQYRARLSAGFQDFARLELLAGETVGVGDLPRIDDADAVAAALERADAADVARSLPSGLETQLGGTWPDGAELSGGQWQKLAVARTLMREEPLLAIFDEPTANIDAQTEHALFERLAAASRAHRDRGGITVLVSHRFSTVRAADHIIVLRSGQIVEQGTHAELMDHDGLYAELFRLQARAYQ